MTSSNYNSSVVWGGAQLTLMCILSSLTLSLCSLACRSKQLTLYNTESGATVSKGTLGFDPTTIACNDPLACNPILALAATRTIHLFQSVRQQ
jgi:hypothetical protein